MHKEFIVTLIAVCTALSASARAGDIVSEVEQNYPYQEVTSSFGDAMIDKGRCLEGTPFWIPRAYVESGTSKEIARQIHETIRGLGANAFVLLDYPMNARSSDVKVIPLTCDLR